MNPNDKQRLLYLMNMSDGGYEHWLMVASEEEIDEALALMNEAREEINVHLQSISTQIADEDLTEASNILKQFTLAGKK